MTWDNTQQDIFGSQAYIFEIRGLEGKEIEFLQR